MNVPLRVAFFAWLVALGKILIMDDLRQRHAIVIDRVVCARGMGSLWIIFSSIVRSLVPYGMAFFNRFGLSWVMPSSVVDLFACWRTGGKSRSVVQKMVPSCLL